MIFQSESTECAIACLAMIASSFGRRVSIADIRGYFPVSLRGLSLRDVVTVADEIGLVARPVRCEPSDLNGLALPLMIHWDMQHFVVLTRTNGGRYTVNDPARGTRTLTSSEFSQHFTGVAILLANAPDNAFTGGGSSLSIARLSGTISDVWKPLVIALFLSAIFEALLLTQPLILRQVISAGFDLRDMMQVGWLVSIGCGAALCASIVSFNRDRALAVTSASVATSIATRLFRHALLLPLQFYEKRVPSHVLERYRSIEPINRFITGEVPVVLLDGVFALLSLTLILFVSVPVAIISVGFVAIHVLYRRATLPALITAEEASVFSRSSEIGFLGEILQNILSVKVMAVEATSHATWLAKFSEASEAQSALTTVYARARAVRTLISGFDLSVFLLLSAYLVIHDFLSAASALALLLFKAHFGVRSSSFVDRVFSFYTLRVHLSRLEDIVLSKSEREEIPPKCERTYNNLDHGCLSLQAASFRYTGFDNAVLQDAYLTISQGEFVVIRGESGSGKTTVLKIMLGLYQLSSGVIACGGLDPSTTSSTQYKRQFGVVLQSEGLFVGTIAENVSFFDPSPDLEKVWWCLNQADIQDEIAGMPMQLDTYVGGPSGGLSGGERQRLLIARALYSESSILLLDEGTANLDADRESRILENLRSLGRTVVMVAHGERPMRAADRVITLIDGKFRDEGAVSEESGSRTRECMITRAK